mmetsp:Transcript_3297/g.11069  ORF Transcript_3297/g.11069 Transcript_3297/m.11069 type:complete len:200 (+) Transcript_3297:2857-3456(+)
MSPTVPVLNPSASCMGFFTTDIGFRTKYALQYETNIPINVTRCKRSTSSRGNSSSTTRTAHSSSSHASSAALGTSFSASCIATGAAERATSRRGVIATPPRACPAPAIVAPWTARAPTRVRPRAAQLRDTSNGLRTTATWLRDAVDAAPRVAAPRIVVGTIVVVIVVVGARDDAVMVMARENSSAMRAWARGRARYGWS